MDRTVNRSYPYPQCAPPLIKDAAEIVQMYHLAKAINDDIQALADTVEAQMSYPPSARLECPPTNQTTTEFVMPYTTSDWSTRPGMVDLAQGLIVIQEPGWYLVTSFVTGAAGNMRSRMVVNGQQRGIWQGYSQSVAGVVQMQDMKTTIHLDTGDTLTSAVRHASAGTISFQGTLAIVSVVSGA